MPPFGADEILPPHRPWRDRRSVSCEKYEAVAKEHSMNARQPTLVVISLALFLANMPGRAQQAPNQD
ncbi:MAG: hypothetical protein DMF97_00265, partial [Acidobacteria bacterium]